MALYTALYQLSAILILQTRCLFLVFGLELPAQRHSFSLMEQDAMSW